MIRISFIAVWLTALWLLLWGDLSWANLLSGIVVAAGVVSLANIEAFARHDDDDAARLQIVPTLYFIGYVFVQLVKANMVLAWEVLTPRNRIRSGVVAVPLRSDSRFVSTIVANIITLTPGTLTIDVDGTPPVLYVHVLHLFDADAERADLQRIEELAIRAFGSRSARRVLAEEAAT